MWSPIIIWQLHRNMPCAWDALDYFYGSPISATNCSMVSCIAF